MLSDNPLAVPCFSPQWVIAKVDEHSLIVQSEIRRAVLRGRAVVIVAEAINGQRSVAELAEYLAPRLSMLELAYVLDRLEQAGYLISALHDKPSEQAFWTLQNLPDAPAQLRRQAVSIKTVGAGFEQLEHILALSGLNCADNAELCIVLCEDYLHPVLAEQIESTTGSILLAKIAGTQAMIGPLFTTTEGPCWFCLEHALQWNRPVQQFMRRLGVKVSIPAPSGAAGQTTAASMLALAAAQILAGDRRLRNTLLSLDLSSLQTTQHFVRRRPQCPNCGNAQWMSSQAEQVPDIQPVEIVFQADGGYRCRTPKQTLDAYRQHVSPLTGVVNYLHPMPGRHSGHRKVYVSGYQVCPQMLSADNSFDKICAGKGQSDEQAQASALCEALERASSVWQGDEWLRISSRSDLVRQGETALSFDFLQNFSLRQYAQREVINAATQDRRRQVPLPADDEALLGWTQGWSLIGNQPCFVPAAYCFAETPMQLGSAFGIYNPNGTAAGNCLEEAIFQGMLELIERDATAIWWYNRLNRPALNLDVLDDPFVEALRREYIADGWLLQVLDLTHDLGIAVYAAVAYHAQTQRYAIGFGCHLQPRLAVSRSLTELNQLLDRRENIPPPWDTKLLPEAHFLHPTVETSALQEVACGVDLKQDIETCLQRLAGAGINAYMVNKTRPDIGLSVVQVILPGLRHFWPRFGAGRLYDVPIAMGWKKVATAEEDLNPAALFL